MGDKDKIEGTAEAWESGELGRDGEFAESVEIDEGTVDEALELQMISIRLQKSLIDDFKLIGKINGIGYQTLMRQILKRFADSEIKRLLRECVLNEEEERERERQLEKMKQQGRKKLAVNPPP
jgi:vacuolar-type H+-ATPase subunit C/Vma6